MHYFALFYLHTGLKKGFKIHHIKNIEKVEI